MKAALSPASEGGVVSRRGRVEEEEARQWKATLLKRNTKAAAKARPERR